MAIKVIRHGTKVFRTTCSICGCEFEYEYEDLQTLYGIAKQVKCPDCGEWLNHREVYPRQPEPSPINPLNPYVTWTTPNYAYYLDCDKCPNKPDPNKIVVGDTSCTWCKKNVPYSYCTTNLQTTSATVATPKYTANSSYGSAGTICTDTLRVHDDIDTNINTNYTTDIKE